MPTMTVTAPVAPARPFARRSVSGARRLRNNLATGSMIAAVVAAMVPLALVILYVVSKGAGVIGTEFFTADLPTTRSLATGMAPAVIGTLVITLGASLMAIPLGILAAIYLNEYGAANRTARVLRFFADVMTGVPSIVMGLFIYTVWVIRFGTAGKTGFAGALALACLMLPIVIRSAESMLALVPDDLREAAYALGCRKSRAILTVILPAALPGITSGSLLAVARAAGETAPILFTVGAANTKNWNLFEGESTTLSAQIFANANQTLPGPQARAWGAALTLIVLVLVLTILARILSSRFSIQR